MSESHMSGSPYAPAQDDPDSSYEAFEQRLDEERQMRQFRYHKRGHAHYKQLYLSVRKFKLIAIVMTAAVFIMLALSTENSLSLQSEVDCLKREIYAGNPSAFACEPLD